MSSTKSKTPIRKNKTMKTMKMKNTDKYVVAIPSYNRAEIIAKKTLEMLRKGRVPSSQIYIFVANETEHRAYTNAVPKELYGKIVIGVKGITKQRRFIVKYFAEGTKIVSMDDDVEKFLRLTPGEDNKRLVPFKTGELDKFFL